jgi:hypothetical protein
MAFDTWTLVGNLDSHERARVDPAGRVVVPGRGWVLDWWIGAEDRWHQPVREAAVRQQLVGSSPVVETRVRIPSGDAVSRAYGARGPRGEDLLVVEVQNDSKVPVALALAVEPHQDGELREVALRGSVLEVEGTTVWLARSPGRFALSTASDGRTAEDVVLSGEAAPVRAASVACDDAGAQGVLLFPLAHTATLRIAVSLDGGDEAVDPTELPSAAQVASGWASHSGRGARIEVPDRRLREAIAASTRFLLLASDDADASLATFAARWQLRGEPPACDPLVIASLVHDWSTHRNGGDDAIGYVAIPAIADLLDAMGERRAAQDVRAIHRSRQPQTEPDDPYELLAAASPTWTWATERAGHDLAVNAALVLGVRRMLVHELGDGLALSPVVPDGWLGMGWEVHDLPTRFGQLSFAVRWHGERPALLWELDASPDRGAVRLTAPALDPAWATTDPRGEALLAAVPVPERPSQRRGLTIPVTIEPMRRPT